MRGLKLKKLCKLLRLRPPSRSRPLEQERQRGEVLVRAARHPRARRSKARKAAANAADASAKAAQASAAEQKQAAEQERQQGEVLAHQLASAREDVGTLTARVTALTDARTEAEKALQTAQASAAEQKQRWNKSASEATPSSVSSHPRARRSKLAKRPQMLRTLRENCPSFSRRAEASR